MSPRPPLCPHEKLLILEHDETRLHTICRECGQELDWVAAGEVVLCPPGQEVQVAEADPKGQGIILAL